MHIRTFQLSDYSSVTSLLHNVLTEVCYEETMEAFARQLSLDSELVLIATVEDHIAGILIGTIDNNKGYYYRIAVDKPYQRQGIGTTMIESMKQKFTQRKVSKILVTMDIHNEIVIPVYESAGYQESDFSRTPHRLSINKKVAYQ